MDPTNHALQVPSSGSPLSLTTVPYPNLQPTPNSLTIRVSAIALNPVDYMLPTGGRLIMPWLEYPFILGSDVSGTVVSVGSSVTRFKSGDRVVGFAAGLDKRVNSNAECGFQEFVVLRDFLTSAIPHDMPFEQACVLPLALSTAACGLFMDGYLKLPLPTVPVRPATGETLLVWGGSSSVGCNALQLAVAAGYEVFTTASVKNHAYLKNLGASECWDYRSPTVVKDISAAFKGRTCAGAFAIGNGSMKACISILGSVAKGRKFIAQATKDLPESGLPQGIGGMLAFGVTMGIGAVSTGVRSVVNGVKGKFIWGSDIVDNGIGKAIYQDFLPAALEKGIYKAAPEPLVVGKGLESLEEGLRVCKEGVSAKKVVVVL